MPSLPENRIARRALIGGTIVVGAGALYSLGKINASPFASEATSKNPTPTPEQVSTDILLTPEKSNVIELGEGVWKMQMAANYLMHEWQMDQEFVPAPASLWSGTNLFVRTNFQGVSELDPATGKEIWQWKPPEDGPNGAVALAADSERLLVLNNNKIYLLDAKTKKEVSVIAPRIIGLPKDKLVMYYRWPIRMDKNVIVISRGQTIEGTYDGFLVYDKNGNFLWESSGNTHERVLDFVDNTIIIGSDNNILLRDAKSGLMLTEPMTTTRGEDGSWTWARYEDFIFTTSITSMPYIQLNYDDGYSMYQRLSISKLNGEQLDPIDFTVGQLVKTLGGDTFCYDYCNLTFTNLEIYRGDDNDGNSHLFIWMMGPVDSTTFAHYLFILKMVDGGLVRDESEEESYIGPQFLLSKTSDGIFSVYADKYYYIDLKRDDSYQGNGSPILSVSIYNDEVNVREEDIFPAINALGQSGGSLIFANWNEEYSKEYKWGTPTVYAIIPSGDQKGKLSWKPVEIKTNALLKTVLREDSIWVIGESITRIDSRTGEVRPFAYIGVPPRHITDTGSFVFVETLDNQLVTFKTN